MKLNYVESMKEAMSFLSKTIEPSVDDTKVVLASLLESLGETSRLTIGEYPWQPYQMIGNAHLSYAYTEKFKFSVRREVFGNRLMITLGINSMDYFHEHEQTLNTEWLVTDGQIPFDKIKAEMEDKSKIVDTLPKRAWGRNDQGCVNGGFAGYPLKNVVSIYK